MRDIAETKTTDSSLRPTAMEGDFVQCKSEVKSLIATILSTDADIDRMVYELYGLTEGEIETIENNSQL